MATGTLISLGGNLENPAAAKASDFSAAGSMGAAGMSEGAGKLVMQTENQTGPRNTQDSGDNTPSVWGKDGEFKVTTAKTEGTSVKWDCSVDFETGSVSPKY